MFAAENSKGGYQPQTTQRTDGYNGYTAEIDKNDFVLDTYLADVFYSGPEVNFASEKDVSSILVDSGCPAAVCGKRWLEKFREKHPDRFVEITDLDTPKRFKFGSNWYNAWQQVKIKANFAGKRGEIFFFVIELNIPALLSRVCLGKLKAKIDFSERMLEIPHWKMKVPLELLYFFEDFSPSQYIFGNAPDFAAEPDNHTSTMIKKKENAN